MESLLSSVDQFRREADRDGTFEGVDAYTRRAFDVLSSSKLVEALDVEKEDPALRDRYGRGSSAPARTSPATRGPSTMT